jgi:diguanylate cyclase (GGDEF)-like protein
MCSYNVSALEEKNVLFISSYSYTWDSVPLQIEGITEKLSASTHLDIEFMDTKKFNSEESYQLFYNEIKYKIAHTDKYDAIIVGDDAALNFAVEYQDDLFKGIPIVFEGINDIEKAKEASLNPYITGIIEKLSYKDTIDYAKKIYPNAKEIVAICDDTITGKGERQQFFDNVSEYPEYNFREIDVSRLTEEQIKEELQSLDTNSLLFYLILSENSDGYMYTSKEAASLIAENASVPVFRMAQPGIDSGLLGGKVVSYEEMGEIAGNIVNEIIDGKDISEFDIILDCPSVYYFNEDVFRKFNISTYLIPENAVVINHKLSFFEENKQMIYIFIISSSLLLLIILFMYYQNNKKKKWIKQLDYIVNHDDLTKLKNRHCFMDDLKKLINRNTKFSLIILGLDDFKRINDAVGIEVGNVLLRQIGDYFNQMASPTQTIYRVSGDEFAIIIETTDENKINDFVNQVIHQIELASVYNNQNYSLTASVGIAKYPYDTCDMNELIAFTDITMYSVKKNGKNNYRYYDKDIEQERLDSLKIDNYLTYAINHDGFKLLYQPLVDNDSLQIASFEALIRLKDYSISPEIFISIAEETGLIIPLGRWIIKQVIVDIATLKNEGKTIKPISINFSAVQLRDNGLIDYIEDLLNQYHVEGRYIEFEITERVFLKMSSEVNEFIERLKDIGIKLVLDDFGAGYSSVQCLADIPFDKIKLDKSMIHRFLNVNQNETMKLLIYFIHSLNLKIVGEGVETKDQFNVLSQFHCDYIQGYLFEKPVEYHKMIEILDKQYTL